MDQWQRDDEPDDALELAIQMSVVDYMEKGKAEAADDEDEDIARAIGESLRISQQQIGSSERNSGRGRSKQIFCNVCDKSISRGNRMLVNGEYWEQYICERHRFDGTPVCCSCKRFQGKYAEYIDLGDTRNICQECFATSIKNETQKQSLIHNVIEFMRVKGLEIKGSIPVFLVDRREMNRHASQGGHCDPEAAGPLGMTMYDTRAGIYVENIESLSQRGSKIIAERKEYPLNYDGGGITIVVLFGLPKAATGLIMAHEFMHAWFCQAGVHDLELEVAEGICQVIAHEWLAWSEVMYEEASSSTRSKEAEFNRTLRQLFKDEVELQSSRAYGDGFREAKWAVEKWGFDTVISHVQKYGSLPQ